MTDRADVLARFERDVASHTLETLRADGVHRHLRFRKPGTMCMHFDIVTWPGILVITGDMGTSVFTRLNDMFEFFRPSRGERAPGEKLWINPGYWAEKCIANDGDKEEFSKSRWARIVKERFDSFFESHEELSPAEEVAKAELWEQVERDVIDTAESVESALAVSGGFQPECEEFKNFELNEMWDYTLTDYRFHFIWRLYAISYAIEQFDALQAAKAGAEPAEVPHA